LGTVDLLLSANSSCRISAGGLAAGRNRSLHQQGRSG
jgi:hypothetical protein